MNIKSIETSLTHKKKKIIPEREKIRTSKCMEKNKITPIS